MKAWDMWNSNKRASNILTTKSRLTPDDVKISNNVTYSKFKEEFQRG